MSRPDSRKPLNAWLKRQARVVRRPLMWSAGLYALDGLALILQAWLLARIIAGVVVMDQTLSDVWPWLWTLLLVFVVRALLSPPADLFAFEAGASIRLLVRERLHQHLQALGPVWARRQRSGAIAQTATDGVEAIDAYYRGYLPQMARVTFLPLAILLAVFPFDWVSGLIMLITAPLIPFFMILIGKGAEALNQRQWRRLTRLSAHFFDVIAGLTTLKLFAASRHQAEVVARLSQAYRKSTMAVLRVAFLSALVLEFLATIAIAMVAVYVGFRLYYGDMTFLPGLFVLLLAPEFYRPLRDMGTQYHARMEALGATEQLIAIFQQRPAATTQASGTTPPHFQRLSVERLAFAYQAGQPVIEEVNFSLERGRRTALIGASGAGKTTIAELLLGLLEPSSGRIRLDDDGERGADWLSRVAWVGQQPTLFHGSIADNIRLGVPQAEEAAIREAARLANAAAFIERLPQAYDTQVGDAGQGLSGGEIQRIALARAFLKQADVVVLDEPAASLDAATEAHITEAIKRLAQQSMTLMIAHRLTTVRDADQLLVLEQGRIVEAGAPADLLTTNSRFAKLLAVYDSDWARS